MYLVALGDFDEDAYSEGDNKIVIWIMFLSASFILLVVFMNMLIAIMGDTFGSVQETQEENSIYE